MFEWIQTTRYHLIDLHDPSGAHFHRAWKACLAGLFTAAFLYFLPSVGQPLAVVAAMIFAHTNSDSNPSKQQLTMLRAVLLTISGICLLGLTSHLLILQMLLIILLSFLAQYVVRFGSQYSASLIWILILVAIAEHPSTTEIPKILLNVVIGFFLAFVCFFWVFPYNPHKALITTAERTKLRLGELLEQIVDRLGQDSRQTTNQIADLKRRIFSLIEAQQSNLNQVKAERSLRLEREIGTARQLIATEQELFEAILVLEQALLPLQYSQLVNVQLKFSLQQFSTQLVALLKRLPLTPVQTPFVLADSTEIIQRLTDDKTQSIEGQVYLANVHLAISILLTKFNALFSETASRSLESVAQENNVPSIKNASNWVFDLNDPVTRRATRTAIAVLISLIVTQLLHLPHADWVVLSAFIVSRDSVGDTLWKAQGRLVGTAFGAAAALAFYALIFRYHTVIFVIAFITVFPYLYLRPSIGKYSYAKFFQQFAFICFLGSLRQTPSASLLEWRAIDIAIGCAIGLAVALLVLPTWARPKWRQGLLRAWQNLQTMFEAVMEGYQSANLNLDQLQRLSQTAQKSVYQLEQHLEGHKHESIMSSSNLSQRLALIEANKSITIDLSNHQTSSPAEIADHWDNLPYSFTLGITGAAFVSGNLYLFNGGRYIIADGSTAPVNLASWKAWPTNHPTFGPGVIDAVITNGDQVWVLRNGDCMQIDLVNQQIVGVPNLIAQWYNWSEVLPPDWVSSGFDSGIRINQTCYVFKGPAVVAYNVNANSPVAPVYISTQAPFSNWPSTWHPQLTQAPSGRVGNLWSVDASNNPHLLL